MIQPTFLIADDDTDDTQLFCEALRNIDSQIICWSASNGEEVFQMLSSQKIPSVIFLDINMPVMDGWECLELLKSNEQYANIPVFIYSTSSLVIDLNKSLSLGATGFISKPANFLLIQQLLREVCDAIRSGNLNQVSEIKGVVASPASIKA